ETEKQFQTHRSGLLRKGPAPCSDDILICGGSIFGFSLSRTALVNLAPSLAHSRPARLITEQSCPLRQSDNQVRVAKQFVNSLGHLFGAVRIDEQCCLHGA